MKHVQVGGHRRGSGLVVQALVDDADYDLVSEYLWSANTKKAGRVVPTCRLKLPDGRTRTGYMHRLIMGLEPDDERVVDHRNGNVLDNRRENLRVCTRAENEQNRPRGAQSRNGVRTSRFRGVQRNPQYRKQWNITLRFDTEEEAARAYEAWRAEHLPFSEPDPAFTELARSA